MYLLRSSYELLLRATVVVNVSMHMLKAQCQKEQELLKTQFEDVKL